MSTENERKREEARYRKYLAAAKTEVFEPARRSINASAPGFGELIKRAWEQESADRYLEDHRGDFGDALESLRRFHQQDMIAKLREELKTARKGRVAPPGQRKTYGRRRNPWTIQNNLHVVSFVWQAAAAFSNKPVWSLVNIASRSWEPRINDRRVDWTALVEEWNQEHEDQQYTRESLRGTFKRAVRDPEVSAAFFDQAAAEWSEALAFWFEVPGMSEWTGLNPMSNYVLRAFGLRPKEGDQ